MYSDMSREQIMLLSSATSDFIKRLLANPETQTRLKEPKNERDNTVASKEEPIL